MNPLLTAITQGNITAIIELIDTGVDVNQFDWESEYSPLGMAVDTNALEIVQLLLEAGANPYGGDSCYTSLGLAAKNGNVSIAKCLIQAGVEVNSPIDEDDYTALMMAAFSGHFPMVQFLMTQGAEVNVWSEGENALMSAARGGHREIYQYLYARADVEVQQWADEAGEREIQATLKRRERQANSEVERFIEAAMLGNLEGVQNAIALGVDVNALGSHGCTALMYAAHYGYIPILEALLQAGADPNILSDNDEGLGEGMTALSLAESSFFVANKREITQILLNYGAQKPD